MSRFAFLIALSQDDGAITAKEDLGCTLIGINRAVMPDKTDLRIITKFSEFQSDGPTTVLYESRGLKKLRDMVTLLDGEVEAKRAQWFVGEEAKAL